MSFRRSFIVDNSGWVVALGSERSTLNTLKSQTVDSHLLLAILEELQALRTEISAQRATSPTPAAQEKP